MLAHKRRFCFLLVALLAIVSSTFRLNFEETGLVVSARQTHTAKHAFSTLQNARTFLNIEEDVEIEKGEELDHFVAVVATFVHFDFNSFQQFARKELIAHNPPLQIGYSQPIYLINNNFRI